MIPKTSNPAVASLNSALSHLSHFYVVPWGPHSALGLARMEKWEIPSEVIIGPGQSNGFTRAQSFKKIIQSSIHHAHESCCWRLVFPVLEVAEAYGVVVDGSDRFERVAEQMISSLRRFWRIDRNDPLEIAISLNPKDPRSPDCYQSLLGKIALAAFRNLADRASDSRLNQGRLEFHVGDEWVDVENHVAQDSLPESVVFLLMTQEISKNPTYRQNQALEAVAKYLQRSGRRTYGA